MINDYKIILLDEASYDLYNKGYKLINDLDYYNEYSLKTIKGSSSKLPKQIAIEIINKHNFNKLTDIHDILKIELNINNKKEGLLLKLVCIPKNNSQYKEIPLNTKLGLAIYKKKIGSNFSYEINDMKVHGKIKSKIKEK